MPKQLARLFPMIAAVLFLSAPITRAHASASLLCGVYYAQKLKPRVDGLDNDKLKHCTLSCLIARRCPSLGVIEVGALKEMYDLVGPGNFEVADMQANIRGMLAARRTKSDTQCFSRCEAILLP